MVERRTRRVGRRGHRQVAVLDEIDLDPGLLGGAPGGHARLVLRAIESLGDEELGGVRVWIGRHDRDRVARSHLAFAQHSGIHPAIGWMVIDRDPTEPAIAEVGSLCRAWIGRRRKLDLELAAYSNAAADGQQRPLDSGSRQVFAGTSGLHGMPFRLKAFDRLDPKKAHGLVGPAMHGEFAVFVAVQTQQRNPGAIDGQFGHAATRDVDLQHTAVCENRPLLVHSWMLRA